MARERKIKMENKNNQVAVNLDDIICVLRAKEIYKNQLDKIPYQDHEDMVLVYQCIVSGERKNMRMMTVTNDVLSYLSMSKEELHNLAYNNMVRKFPPSIKGLESGICDFIPVGSDTINSTFMDGLQKNEEMYFLTNSMQCMGATYLADSNVMNRLSAFFDDDLIALADADIVTLIPLSTLKGIDMTVDDLEKIEVWNNKQLEKNEDIITEHVKVWKADSGKLENLTQEYVDKKLSDTKPVFAKGRKKKIR